MDVGHRSSKLATAYCPRNEPGRQEVGLVEFLGDDLFDPQRPPTGESLYEAISLLGITDKGGVVQGRPARALDLTFPLKTTIALRALGQEHRQIVAGLAGGLELLRAYDLGCIPEAKMHEQIVAHLEYLREAGEQHAAKQQVRITSVGFSYPNFWENTESAQHRLHFILTDYLERTIKSVFGAGVAIRISPINEGQAIAKMICERFWDPVKKFYRQHLSQLFPDMADDRSVVLLILDAGSGSAVCVFPPGPRRVIAK